MRSASTARGTATAVLSAVLTAVGHLAGGGAVPDLAVLVVLLPLLATAFVSAAGACRAGVGTVAMLAVGQLVLHQVMALLHPGHDAASAAPGAAAMFGMHAAVTIVTAVALRFADHAVSALVTALGRVLPRRLTPLPALRPLRLPAPSAAGLPARLAATFATSVLRRGPPVCC